MATRHPFGGGIADYAIEADPSTFIAIMQPGAAITAWNAREGGTQYLNLSADPAGSTPITGVLTSDGSDGYALGEIPIFYGPEDITQLWISADGGPRVSLGSIDSPALAGEVNTRLDQHLAASNPHGTPMSALADVDFPTPLPAGAYPVWNTTTEKWEVSTAGGLNPNAFVSVVGGSVVRVAEGNNTLVAQEWRGPAGNRDAAPNLLQTAWNNGTAGAPTWALGAYVNAYAELRARATRDTGVAFRIERRSSGAGGDLLQVVSEAGVVLAFINAKGQIRAANLGRSIPFTAAGTLTNNPGKFVFFNDTGTDLVLRSIRFWLDTVGSSTTVLDVNDNGTTLYPTTKPQLASGVQTLLLATALTIVAGHRISIDVDTAGTGAKDLTAQLELW
jgi:hypothetical protein